MMIPYKENTFNIIINQYNKTADPYERLCDAVIIQAILDYKNAVKRNDLQTIEEVEEFFSDGRCWIWNGMNGDKILYYLREMRKRGTFNVL